MVDSPDPWKVLRQRAKEANAPLGLELRQFTRHVGEEGEQDVVQIVFTINASRVGETLPDDEQKQFDLKFEQLAQNFEDDKREDAKAKARAEIEELRRQLDGDGLFGSE